jgi:hypothetical protein
LQPLGASSAGSHKRSSGRCHGQTPWAVHHGRCGSELCREPSPLCRKLSLGLHVEMARPPTFPYRSASDDGMAVGYRECRRALENCVIDRMGRVSLGVGSRLQTCSCMRVWYRRTIIVARYEFCPFKLHVSRCHGRRMCASRPCVTRHPRFALVVGSLTFVRRGPPTTPESACRSDPTPANPRGEAGAEVAISHLVQHLE